MSKENIVKTTCIELDISQKELAEQMGVSEGTLRNWSSSNDLPKWALQFIDVLLRLHEKNKILDSFQTAVKGVLG